MESPPLYFDPSRHVRLHRPQVAGMVAASFVGCLLALLFVYGIILIITKLMAAKIAKDALIGTDTQSDELPGPPIAGRPAKTVPIPQPQPDYVLSMTSAQKRLLDDLRGDDADETDEADLYDDPEPFTENPADFYRADPVPTLPAPEPTPVTPTATASTTNSRKATNRKPQ